MTLGTKALWVKIRGESTPLNIYNMEVLCVGESESEKEKEGVKSEEKKAEDAEWEPVPDAETFEFKKEGDSIEGKFIHLEKDVGKHNSKLYTLEKEDGAVIKIWGSKILDDKMMQIKFGTEIKVEFRGKVKPEKGGNEYNDYEVYTKQPMGCQ